MLGACLRISRDRPAVGVVAGLLILLAAYAAPAATSAAQAAPGPQKKSLSSFNQEWANLVAAAKQERRLVVSVGGAETPREIMKAFGKKFGIDLVMGRGSGGAQAERLVAERRGRVYNMDIVVGGARTYSDTLLPAKALDPIKPLLFHPEVVNQSLWKGGIHRYADPEDKYVFLFAARNAPIGININTKLVRPGEIKSFWDLFDPKWKGKIVAIQPRVGGITWGWIYHHKSLGPEFLRRIYTEGVLSFVATGREFADGLAVGAYAIGFLQGTGATDLLQLQQKGMPIKLFTAHDLPDLGVGRAGPGGSGMIGVVNRPPHPNAQKLFVNWFLTREAQLYFNKELPDGSPPEYESLRVDVPNDRMVPEYRLTPNFYIPEADPDFVEKENAAVKFVHQVLDKLGR